MKYYSRFLKGRKQPSIYKSYPRRPKINLSRKSSREAPLFGALRSRHSMREFSGKPISFNELSRLAYYTWGRISYYETREFGKLLHKTSPSAGARHPIETYAIVNNVKVIEPGIHLSAEKTHSMELMTARDAS